MFYNNSSFTGEGKEEEEEAVLAIDPELLYKEIRKMDVATVSAH